jgi:hypothetical protein
VTEPVVAVPAELELDERLVGPVTFRMAAWLALGAAGAVLVALGPGRVMPVLLGLPMILLGAAGAFWRPGGRPALSWVGPLWSYRRRIRSGGQQDDDNLNPHKQPRRRPTRDVAARRVMTWTPNAIARRLREPRRANRPFVPSRPVDTGRALRLTTTAAAALLLMATGFAGGRLAHARQANAHRGGQLVNAVTPSPVQTSPPTSDIPPIPALRPTTPEPRWSHCGC